MEDIYAIILAAGKGTRMKAKLPKCAYPFCGKAMVEHIVDNCKKSGIDNIVVVVGYKKEDIEIVLGTRVNYAIQKEQLGTGHAVMSTEEFFKNKTGKCLIFPGDMPMIDIKTINDFINIHNTNHNDLTIATTFVEDPTGYGRIYRENNKVKRIIEHRNASEEVKQIKEINSGMYCIDIKLLFEALKSVSRNPLTGEYYLTDIVEILANNYCVDTFIIEDNYILTGINDLESLKKAEILYKSIKKA